jgi:BirA family biotin operon repressor/biotin-[acetyl-CoA-carboxylase] ligase
MLDESFPSQASGRGRRGLDQAFAPHFLRYDTLPSTNTEALRQARAGAEEGLCVIAREQTAGRGRQSRGWASRRDGGLYLSVLLRPRLPLDQWPLLTLMTAVAVHEALHDAFDLGADIKWPNDILASNKKLGGILAETVDTSTGRAAVIGIGVNLRRDAVPEELIDAATSVAAETADGMLATADPGEFAEVTVNKLGEWYRVLQQPHGRTQVRDAWTERSSYAMGRPVSVATGNETFEGVTQGLADDGALRVATKGGNLRLLYSAEITALRPLDSR